MISILEIELRKILAGETQLLSQCIEALLKLELNGIKLQEGGQVELAESIDCATEVLYNFIPTTKDHIKQLNELLNKIDSQYEIGKNN